MTTHNRSLQIEILVKRREALGKSKKEIAEEIGASTHMVYIWEKIGDKPNLPNRRKAVIAYELTTDDIKKMEWPAMGVINDANATETQLDTKTFLTTIQCAQTVLTATNTKITFADIRFLLDTQEQMPNPISMRLMVGLLNNRHNIILENS